MTYARSLVTAVIAALIVSPVFAQTGAAKATAQTKTTTTKTTTIQPKKVSPHWIGVVKSMSDKKLSVMVGKKDFNVDASKAKVYMNRKPFALVKLSSGSRVSVYGKAKGMDVAAKSIYVLRVGPAKAPAKKPTPPKKKATTKTTTGAGKTTGGSTGG